MILLIEEEIKDHDVPQMCVLPDFFSNELQHSVRLFDFIRQKVKPFYDFTKNDIDQFILPTD